MRHCPRFHVFVSTCTPGTQKASSLFGEKKFASFDRRLLMAYMRHMTTIFTKDKSHTCLAYHRHVFSYASIHLSTPNIDSFTVQSIQNSSLLVYALKSPRMFIRSSASNCTQPAVQLDCAEYCLGVERGGIDNVDSKLLVTTRRNCFMPELSVSHVLYSSRRHGLPFGGRAMDPSPASGHTRKD